MKIIFKNFYLFILILFVSCENSCDQLVYQITFDVNYSIVDGVVNEDEKLSIEIEFPEIVKGDRDSIDIITNDLNLSIFFQIFELKTDTFDLSELNQIVSDEIYDFEIVDGNELDKEDGLLSTFESREISILGAPILNGNQRNLKLNIKIEDSGFYAILVRTAHFVDNSLIPASTVDDCSHSIFLNFNSSPDDLQDSFTIVENDNLKNIYDNLGGVIFEVR